VTQRPPAHRLVAMLVIFVVALSAIVVKLASLQVRGNGELAQLGLDQRVRTTDLPADRGPILDRDGMPLAISREARDVYADPRLVTDREGEALAIARVLDLRPIDVRVALGSHETFVYIDRQVDLATADELEALQLPGIGFLEVPERYYPAGSLAPKVLGLVDVDGIGIAGLENEYHRDPAGRPGPKSPGEGAWQSTDEASPPRQSPVL